MIDNVGEKEEHGNASIELIDTAVELIQEGEIDGDRWRLLVKKFVADPGAIEDINQRGLLAYLFLSFGGEGVDREGNIDRVLKQCKTQSPLIKGLVNQVGILRQGVGNFFTLTSRISGDSNFFIVPLSDNSLVNRVVGLECQQLKRVYGRVIEKRGLGKDHLVEAFVNSETGENGVWMSKAGEGFSMKGLRRLQDKGV